MGASPACPRSPSKGIHHWAWKGAIESDTIYNYLVNLKLNHLDREVVVVMDNAPTHTGKWMKTNIAAIPELHVRYLPLYSPELNPDEKVWRELKHHRFRHRGARTHDALMKLVTKKMQEIAGDRNFLLEIIREFRELPAH